MTFIIVDDLHSKRKYTTVRGPAEKNLINKIFYTEDEILKHYSMHIAPSKRRYKWCDLTVPEYKLIIATMMTNMDKLDTTDLMDGRNTTVQSFYFLIGCMIKSIEENTGMIVESINIKRLSEFIIDYKVECMVPYPDEMDSIFSISNNSTEKEPQTSNKVLKFPKLKLFTDDDE